MGSWLSGPGTGGDYRPGQRLGRPAAGPGSVAGFGRRLVALVLDWLLCLLIAAGLLRGGSVSTLLVFAAENLLLVSLVGATLGHRVLGLRVSRVDGGRASPLAVVIRTVLLVLAIPALIWDKDGRGLHDKAVGTLVVRT
jgi:uncharacterized RDD family membrane protein YckC